MVNSNFLFQPICSNSYNASNYSLLINDVYYQTTTKIFLTLNPDVLFLSDVDNLIPLIST